MGIIKKVYYKKEKEKARIKELAWDTAEKIARILGRKFGAQRVILYGSLAREEYFDSASDIDIAVEGLRDKFFHVYSYCGNLTEFDIDIRDYDEMPPEFKRMIAQKGKVLYERRREIRE